MELQYLQNLKRLENNFLNKNKQAMFLSTFDEESICMTLNIFNNFEYIDIQDKNFKSIQNSVTNNKIGTALIELCSNFSSFEEVLNKYIDKCSDLKHETSDLLANLTIIKPLFTDLGKLNIYFENLKEIEIENFKNKLNDFIKRKDDILNFDVKHFKKLAKKSDSNIFTDIIDSNQKLKEYIVTENVKTFTLDYIKTYLLELKEIIKLLELYSEASQESIYKTLKLNEKLFLFNILENPILSFTYPLSKIEPKIKIGDQYVNYEDFKLTNFSDIKPGDPQAIVNTIKQNEIALFTSYRIKNIKDLLIISLLELIKNKTTIRKCKNCNMYFIPESRSDEVYCTRISPQNKNKTCKEYGVKNSYRETLKSDLVRNAHNRTYQFFTMKVARASNEKEKTKYEKLFDKYKTNYQKQKKKYLDNKLSDSDFASWITAQKEI